MCGRGFAWTVGANDATAVGGLARIFHRFTQFERIHLLAMIDHARVVEPKVLKQILPNRVRTTDSMVHAHRRRQLNPRARYLHGYMQTVKQVRDHLDNFRERLHLELVAN